MKLDIVLNVLAVVLFLGFGMAALIAFSTLDKQKEITVVSRYGRQIHPIEIIYVNVSIGLIALMIVFHNYRFFPTLVMLIILVFLNSRIQSGLSPLGVFVGTNHLEWREIAGYRIVNDAISTIRVLIYANSKCYVIRCDKECRSEVEQYFTTNGIALRQDGEEG